MRAPWRWALLAALLMPARAQGYADRAGTDVVLDAPWRTVRDTVPLLVFTPQFERGRRIEVVRLFECVAGAPVAPPVFVDAAGGPDTLNGVTFVGPLGGPRGGLEAGERVRSQWHYVARVPHAALRRHASPDVHTLRAEVTWSRPGRLGRTRLVTYRVLRVVVDPTPFPAFAPEDRYLDTHVHTIAEQTTAGPLDVNGASKAYGGPLVMLAESAYALGLVESRPAARGWDALADRLVVTDHNIFYSRRPYDTGAAPRFGPTATTDGGPGEAAWYRAHLGRLAGEEVTLRRGPGQDRSPRPNIGHHLLVYGGPHLEGPWHGGLFLTSTLENPNTPGSVLTAMRAAGGGAFCYASHPCLEGFEWPDAYDAEAIGLPPHDSNAGPQVDAAGTGFLFKGAEVWNSKLDRVAHRSGRLAASSAFDAMDPFEGGAAAQRFEPRAWDGELERSLHRWLGYVGRGLDHSFREAPEERFVRKLYLSAGSDAHGDFNYTDEVLATPVPYSGALNANAFARVRTYALVHERPEGSRDAVAALAGGNTVLTDGPLLAFSLDANGRDDPRAGAARWHDASSRWENADGRIGGSGGFDGGGTALVAGPGDAWIRSTWRRSVTPGAGAPAALRFDRVTAAGRDSFRLEPGAEGVAADRPVPVALGQPCALLATARDPAAYERCITNPVWTAPVRIEVAADPRVGPSGAVLPAGALRVTYHFPYTMSATAPARVALRPLDATGTSTEPEIPLQPVSGWEAEDGVARARLSLVNATPIALPAAAWDADAHAAAPGRCSFVVYFERPTDLHGNTLNDVARAFTVARP